MPPVYMAAHSLIRHINTGEKREIIILCPKPPKKQTAEYFRRLEKGEVKVRFVPSGESLDGLKLNPRLAHISAATYFRFLIPELLPEYDACLYLDADIIVKGDIDELLHTDPGDNLIMGVRDVQKYYAEPEKYAQRCAECSINDLDHYINAGVLLMNIKALKQAGICKMMIADCAEHTYRYNDQDVLNKYCYGRTGLLPLRYNFMVPYLGYAEYASGELGEDVKAVKESCAIIHYASRQKPWNFFSVPCRVQWQKALRRIQLDVLVGLINPFVFNQMRRVTLKERYRTIKQLNKRLMRNK